MNGYRIPCFGRGRAGECRGVVGRRSRAGREAAGGGIPRHPGGGHTAELTGHSDRQLRTARSHSQKQAPPWSPPRKAAPHPLFAHHPLPVHGPRAVRGHYRGCEGAPPPHPGAATREGQRDAAVGSAGRGGGISGTLPRPPGCKAGREPDPTAGFRREKYRLGHLPRPTEHGAAGAAGRHPSPQTPPPRRSPDRGPLPWEGPDWRWRGQEGLAPGLAPGPKP